MGVAVGIICPHCGKTARGSGKVLESRPLQGEVWRRRMCNVCLTTFVTRESSGADLKMPNLTQSRHRTRMVDRAQSPFKGDLSKRSCAGKASASLASALSSWGAPPGASDAE